MEKEKATAARLWGVAKARQRALKLHSQGKMALKLLPGDTRFLAGLADLLIIRRS